MLSIEKTAEVVLAMDKHLRNELLKKDGILQEKKLWENTHIKHQIDNRESGYSFSLSDHIRAMVYSMLSSGIRWERVEDIIDTETGRIVAIDELFHQYDAEYIRATDPMSFVKGVFGWHCGSQYTKKQMDALKPNLQLFGEWIKQTGSIDSYYQQFISDDQSLNELIKQLSDCGSQNKLKQLGIPLTAEYLKSVGYSVAKPDRHICRILGNTALGCFDKSIVPPFEAINYISAIAKEIEKPAAEVDYILWMYCADGYGEICTKRSPKRSPKCDICKANGVCKYYQNSKIIDC